jgi:putative addiction module CopG family antidote
VPPACFFANADHATERDTARAETGRALVGVFVFDYLEDVETEATMSQPTTMTVRISGALSEFVASNVGENGAYENISEYVRDLIRRDKERVEREAFERLKAELTRAFEAPEESYRPLTAAEVIARNRG